MAPKSLTDGARLISLLRRPRELLALVSEPVGKTGAGCSFVAKSIPLNDLPPSLFPKKERLQKSWRSLEHVMAADEDALFQALILLVESVPDLSIEHDAGPLPPEWLNPQKIIAPTAAHPRAYKGTKNQPPKPKRLAKVDIRPYLCGAGSLRAVLFRLQAFRPRAEARLKAAGYPESPFDAIRHAKSWTLPVPFAQYLWPRIRWQSPREISQWLSIYAALEAGTDEGLLVGLATLLAVSDAPRAFSWVRVTASLPAHRRALFVGSVVETGAHAVSPEPTAAARMQQICELATDELFPLWTRCFLETLRDGHSAGYLLSGFRLAAHFRPSHFFDPSNGSSGNCDDFPEKVVEEIGIELGEDGSPAGWLSMALWERCGRFRGFGQMLGASNWRKLTPEAARRYFDFLIGIAHCELPERAVQLKWEAIRKQVPRIEDFIASIPEAYQVKAVAHISAWLEAWDDPQFIERRMPGVLQMIGRSATPPFLPTGGADYALGSLMDMPDDSSMDRLLDAPTRSFEILERACRRTNDAVLICRGLDTLAEEAQPFTLDA